MADFDLLSDLAQETTLASLLSEQETSSGWLSVVSDFLDHLVEHPHAPNKVQFEYRWDKADPNDVLVVNEQTGTASATKDSGGFAKWSTGPTAGSVIDMQTPEAGVYSATYDSSFDGTFTFSPITGDGEGLAGAFTDKDGFGFYATSSTFGVFHGYNGDLTNPSRPGWTFIAVDDPLREGDPFDGNTDPSAGPVTRYTKNGVGIIPNANNIQIGQIKFRWFGAGTAAITVESPDGHHVVFHKFTFINQAAVVSLTDPDLPMRVRIDNGSTAEVIEAISGCWAVGSEHDRRERIKVATHSKTFVLAPGEDTDTLGTFPWVSDRHYEYQTWKMSADDTLLYYPQWTDNGATADKVDMPTGAPFETEEINTDIDVYFKNRRDFFKPYFENNSAGSITVNLEVYFEDEPPKAPQGLAKDNIERARTVAESKSILMVDNGTQFETVSSSNPVPVEVPAGLVDRMLNFKAQVGYTIGFDVEDLNYFYIMEAPIGTAAGSNGWMGIRIPKTVAGSPSYPVEVNTSASLNWTNYKAHGSWT